MGSRIGDDERGSALVGGGGEFADLVDRLEERAVSDVVKGARPRP